jgi:uncharacterized protein (UPF0179 family)
MVVTLVGETQAKVGYTFFFRGPISECRDCKRKTVCFNLEEGTLYEIVGVRDKHHDCNIHEGGVRVVELRKAPIETTVDSNYAIEGSMVIVEKEECLNIGCKHHRVCFTLDPKINRKYKVANVKSDLKCPDGRNLKLVVLVD